MATNKEEDIARGAKAEVRSQNVPSRLLPQHLTFRISAILLGLILLPGDAIASDDPDLLCPEGNWNPKVEFQLDKASYRETLIWLSGWSYALTAIGRSEAKSDSPKYCLPKCGIIMGKPLLDFLNGVFKGQAVSSEQASDALWTGVQAIYRCKEK